MIPELLVGVGVREEIPPVNVASVGEIAEPALVPTVVFLVVGAAYGGGGLAIPSVAQMRRIRLDKLQ